METIFFGGNIITMENKNRPEAVLIRDSIIAKVGSLEMIRENTTGKADEINLEGKTLMPGFIDGHSHISMAAQMALAADLRDCLSFDDIVRTLQTYLEEKEIGSEGILFGFGYDHNFLLEGIHPSKKELNEISAEIPIIILHVSGHMGVVNDAALSLAGVSGETLDVTGGKIGRESGSGEPDGYLEEAALMYLQTTLMPRIRFDMVAGLLQVQNDYLKHGITTVQDGAASRQSVDMIKKAGEAGLLKVDVVSYPVISDDINNIFEENKEHINCYSSHFKLGGYKVILDGSPQGKSAWLTKPYENSDGYCAYSWFQDEQVELFMKKAIRDKRQILAHCNGDAASDQFINCYEKALGKSDNPDKANLRPVMIHCQTVRKDQLDKMAELKMIPSIFVGHAYYWGDVHLKNLGLERGRHISPCHSAFERGLVVNFHQDTPVTKPDMMHSVWCAVNRITRNGDKIGEDECIGVYEALKAITINAAYSYFEEESKGSIVENKIADLVVLDKNPLEVPKEDLKNIQIMATYKEGRVVYKK